jgi:uncharacterized protein
MGLFSEAFGSSTPASSWVEARTIPRDLIIGIIGTFIGLVILFSIKPKLKIELDPDGGFRVTNKGLRQVIDVKARLFRVDGSGKRLRHKIDLANDELFSIRGWLSRSNVYLETTGDQNQHFRATWGWLLRTRLKKRLGRNHASAEEAIQKYREKFGHDKRTKRIYTFWPRGDIHTEINQLKAEDYILFQVLAKSGFTGFTRLKTRRFYRGDLRVEPKKAVVMEQRINLVNLGVNDLARARQFYEKLGWRGAEQPDDQVCFFQAGGTVFGLWTGLGGHGASGIELAYSVRSPEEVSATLEKAEQAGGTIVRQTAAKRGGTSGAFSDPEGYVWEVAHNPGWTLSEDGTIHI